MFLYTGIFVLEVITHRHLYVIGAIITSQIRCTVYEIIHPGFDIVIVAFSINYRIILDRSRIQEVLSSDCRACQ